MSSLLKCVSSVGELEAKRPKKGDSSQISWRIVNGTNAMDDQVPFQGSLQINGTHHCGCVIITSAYQKSNESEWLLTAAHCVVR